MLNSKFSIVHSVFSLMLYTKVTICVYCVLSQSSLGRHPTITEADSQAKSGGLV